MNDAIILKDFKDKIKFIEILSLKKGDILCLKLDKKISNSLFEELEKGLKDILSQAGHNDIPTCILDPCMELKVVRKANEEGNKMNKDSIYYPIFICKGTVNSKTCFGVTVPDLPGCFSAGDTLEEAIENAKEAIQCHREGLEKDGGYIPETEPLENHLNNPNFEEDICVIVKIPIDNE